MDNQGTTGSDASPAAAASPAASRAASSGACVWALAGGKGGVGRTLLTANLGIQLARSGRRVVLVDLDLQGANLQACLGYQRLPRSLADLASGKVALLSETACETPTTHLRLVGGLQRGELRDDPVAFVRQVAEQFPSLSADHVIVDCGSGRSPATVAAFAESDIGILVTTPEPAALESVYLFAEAHLRWCLVRALTGEVMTAAEAKLRHAGIEPRTLSFRALMTHLGRLDPASRDAVTDMVRRTRLELLLNQVRGEADEEAAACLQSGFRKCFGLSLHTAGVIEHDLSILQAVQKRRPLSQQYPNAASTRGIARAAARLLSVAIGPARDAAEEWEDLDAIDHYRVLEVVPKASPKEVQSAYQLLKKTYDPETTFLSSLLDAPGLRDLQARIESAYRTLIFLESRSDYDRRMLQTGRLGDDQVRGLHAGAAPAPPSGAAPDLELAGGRVAPAPAPTAPRGAAAGGTTTGISGTTMPPPAGTEAPPSAPVVAAVDPAAGAASSEAGATGPEAPSIIPSSGAELRDERQRRRMAIEAIAGKTKIRRAYLQAIEEERFGELPAAVFVRGFLKEYARCLGLPGEEVTRLYMKRYQDWHESRNAPGAPGASSSD
jgi:flagellar biosynthesis protein FlhG